MDTNIVYESQTLLCYYLPMHTQRVPRVYGSPSYSSNLDELNQTALSRQVGLYRRFVLSLTDVGNRLRDDNWCRLFREVQGVLLTAVGLTLAKIADGEGAPTGQQVLRYPCFILFPVA